MRKIYYNKPAEWLELSVDNTPQANLRIGTISGLPYFVDWGDGIVETYTNSQTITKVYTSNFTGVIRIATPMGLGDVGSIEINDNLSRYNFDATALSGCVNMTAFRLNDNAFTGDMSGVSALTSLTYLYLNSSGLTGNMSSVSSLISLTTLYLIGTSFTGDMSGVSGLTLLTTLWLNGTGFTGNMSGVSALTSLTILYLRSNLFTGDMSGASQLPLLNHFYISGKFTINYTSTVFAPNFRYWLFRPSTSTNPMSSTEIDQMLIDASQTTWAVEKNIYADGNNGVRTSASDAAVLTLQGMGVTLYLNI